MILGSLLYRDKRAEDMWDELYVRQNTGILAVEGRGALTVVGARRADRRARAPAFAAGVRPAPCPCIRR